MMATNRATIARKSLEARQSDRSAAERYDRYTAYAVYVAWTHSKTGQTHRDRIAYNLDRDTAAALAAARNGEIVPYQTATFTASW